MQVDGDLTSTQRDAIASNTIDHDNASVLLLNLCTDHASKLVRSKVKWFDPVRNFGFIECDDQTQPDVFMHGSSVGDDLPERLEGVKVSFEVVPSPKNPGKLCADNVGLAK